MLYVAMLETYQWSQIPFTKLEFQLPTSSMQELVS